MNILQLTIRLVLNSASIYWLPKILEKLNFFYTYNEMTKVESMH